MTTPHEFLFKPGTWIGEGKISFSVSPDHIHFYTRWTPSEKSNTGTLEWTQEVEMQGNDEKMINQFIITPLKPESFSIEFDNILIGSAVGHGVIEPHKIAWEIKTPEIFHGFEVYTLEENGDYRFHAEYAAQDNFRTIIEGRIWKKAMD